MWSLANPLVLLLLPLPWLVTRHLASTPSDAGAMRVPESVAARLLSFGAARWDTAGLKVLPWLIWAGLLLAVAGPQAIGSAPVLLSSGRDIILALDLSGSMEREDFELDGEPARRIDAVKRVASEFLRGRKGDRVALVIFSEAAYFAAPPTHDVESVARALEEASTGISGRSTSISDGLGLAMKRLAVSEADTKVVILLSDGINTAGDVSPIEAARLATSFGVRVHTIALGPRDMRESGANEDAVDTETLERIASTSGGRAFRVRDTTDLAAVGQELDRVEPNSVGERVVQVQKAFWMYPAGLAFGAAVVLLLLRRRM
ncbi:VWA domain-containing protein [Faunimonas sp. B44]|uniref:VWA domain-containing protein n=1 Tax=Faunimonas sp. B44 TaxID=3461493 RepID=UPI0040449766